MKDFFPFKIHSANISSNDGLVLILEYILEKLKLDFYPLLADINIFQRIAKVIHLQFFFLLTVLNRLLVRL